MLIGGPQFHLRVRERGGHRLHERSQLFLKASCCSSLGSTWCGRGLLAVLESLQIVPAALGGDWTTEFGRHPVGQGACPPAFGSIRSRTRERLSQLLLLLDRQHPRCPPRGRVLPIDHAI